MPTSTACDNSWHGLTYAVPSYSSVGPTAPSRQLAGNIRRTARTLGESQEVEEKRVDVSIFVIDKCDIY